jgi:hypothetical protein
MGGKGEKGYEKEKAAFRLNLETARAIATLLEVKQRSKMSREKLLLAIAKEATKQALPILAMKKPVKKVVKKAVK